jgi:Uma2 family endonuclease
MPEITNINQLDFSKSYTYADYLTWSFQERVELILGKIIRMSPAPGSKHQQISIALGSAIYNFLKRKSCKVFTAPFDVILPVTPGLANTVVQPDISVVCDLTKITDKGCNGAPDLVVEVVSKSSVARDLHEKYRLYEKAAIAEYWIVQPEDRTLVIFLLDAQGKYQPSKPLTKGDVAKCSVLPGLEIDLNELFVDLVEEPETDYHAANRI